MKRHILISSAVLFLFTITAIGQVPIKTAIQILKAEDSRSYGKTLENLMANPNAAIRERAALAAGRIGDESAIPFLTSLLEKDVADKVQTMAAFALGEIESIKAADPIIAALQKPARSKGTTVTARLVEAAGKIAAANPKEEKAKQLLEAILTTLDVEDRKGIDQNREVILLALTAAGRAGALDPKRNRPDDTDFIVAKFLKHADARIRADAGNTLTRLRSKNANEVLRSMLENDTDAVARANAARALGAAEDKEALDLLLKVASADKDSRVRVSATRSLALLKDAKAADILLARAEKLFGNYKTAKYPNPLEKNELLEIATTLGRLLTNTDNERAVSFLKQYALIDNAISPEIVIARVRISQTHGDGKFPEVTSWLQLSTLAQLIGEFAVLKPVSDQGKKLKAEAPDVIRPLAKAYTGELSAEDQKTVMAAPDILRAFAQFKTSDLLDVLREYLLTKDVFMRAAAAELMGDQPVSKENTDALKAAFIKSLGTDKFYNDAQLAILDALFKLDKNAAADVLDEALIYQDHLVRKKALDLLKNKDTWKNVSAAMMNELYKSAAFGKDTVWPHDPKSGSKLGQILNSDADYRRALSRKNGSINAVLNTEKGSFTIDFYPEEAPLTVDNFIKLARRGYFNGVEVHRVVPNFVTQDGDPRGDGNGGPGWSIRCEINMLPYDRGAVGMALSGKDTGGSQWFVTHSPQPHLDGGYTVFGRVRETDMRVVDNIVRGDKIISVRIIEPGRR